MKNWIKDVLSGPDGSASTARVCLTLLVVAITVATLVIVARVIIDHTVPNDVPPNLKDLLSVTITVLVAGKTTQMWKERGDDKPEDPKP